MSLLPLQVFWALQLVTVLVPGAVFHLYAACKNTDQEEILEQPLYTVFYIISVLLRIILEVIAFWLQSHLFGFQVGLDFLSLRAQTLRSVSVCSRPSDAGGVKHLPTLRNRQHDVGCFRASSRLM